MSELRSDADARRRHRALGLTAAVAVLALAGTVTVTSRAGKGSGDGVEVAAGGRERASPPGWTRLPAPPLSPPGWTRLPAPPLSPRNMALAATVGDQVVVVGGTGRGCPPGQLCSYVYATVDGAAFSLSTRTWHKIADAPQPLTGSNGVKATVVGDDIYVLGRAGAPCALGSDCGAQLGSAVLRYRTAADAWDVLPGPPTSRSSNRVPYELVSFGKELVATSASGVDPDWRLDPASAGAAPGPVPWVRLPKDPLGATTERHMVSVGPDLLLFASPVVESLLPPPASGARFDLASGAWTAIAPMPEAGVQIWAVDATVIAVYASAHALDLATGRWRSLPGLPSGPVLPMGVVGLATSAFTFPGGWVFDVSGQAWIEIPQPGPGPTPPNGAVTSVGRGLFLFGGQARSGDFLDDTWIWAPPDPGPPTEPAAPVPAATVPPPPGPVPTLAPETATTVPPATTPIAPTVPTTSKTPTTPPTSGPTTTVPIGPPPELLSATGDAKAGTVTLHFTRPVVVGDGAGFDQKPVPPVTDPYMSAMQLAVHMTDSCTNPNGNAHRYVRHRHRHDHRRSLQPRRRHHLPLDHPRLREERRRQRRPEVGPVHRDHGHLTN